MLGHFSLNGKHRRRGPKVWNDFDDPNCLAIVLWKLCLKYWRSRWSSHKFDNMVGILFKKIMKGTQVFSKKTNNEAFFFHKNIYKCVEIEDEQPNKLT
jgi:hypothetical protein